MTALWLLMAAGVVSWTMRVWFVAVVPADRLPPRVGQILSDATPAVLAALTAVLVVGGLRGAGGARASHAVALLVAVALSHWKDDVTLAVFGAMAAELVVQLIV